MSRAKGQNFSGQSYFKQKGKQRSCAIKKFEPLRL